MAITVMTASGCDKAETLLVRFAVVLLYNFTHIESTTKPQQIGLMEFQPNCTESRKRVVYKHV